MLACFLRLADVIAALVVIRILLQFLVQIVGLLSGAPSSRGAAPVPHVALSASRQSSLSLDSFSSSSTARTRLQEIRYALVILVSGL